jgi:hypothetical protein
MTQLTNIEAVIITALILVVFGVVPGAMLL